MDDTDTTNILLMSRQKDPVEEVMRVFREEMRDYEEAQLIKMEEEEARRTGVDVAVIRRNRLQREAEKEGAFDTDLEDEEVDTTVDQQGQELSKEAQKRIQLQKVYDKACKKFKTVPSSQFRDQVLSPVVKVAHLSLTLRDWRPIAVILSQNSQLTTVDLSDNCLGCDGLPLLFGVLLSRKTIVDLNISNNHFGALGGDAIERNIECFVKIRKLNLSGNDFIERNAGMVCAILQFCSNLRTLFLSGNNFNGEVSKIASVLGPNQTLENLRFSWNNVRGKGAIDFAKALKVNGNLVQLDISWNGFSDEGARVLGESLATNDSLVSIDLSFNRIGIQGAFFLAKGLLKNETLEDLTLHGNYLNSQGGEAIVKAIKANPNRRIKKLEMKNCSIPYEVAAVWEESSEIPYIRCDSFVRVHDKCEQFLDKTKQNIVDSNNQTDVFSLVNLYLHVNDISLFDRAKEFYDFLGKPIEEEIDGQNLKRILNRIPIPTTEEKINNMVDHLPTNENGKYSLRDLQFLFPWQKSKIDVNYVHHRVI